MPDNPDKGFILECLTSLFGGIVVVTTKLICAGFGNVAFTHATFEIVPDDNAQVDDKEKDHHVVNKRNPFLIGQELFRSPKHKGQSYRNPDQTLTQRAAQGEDENKV